MNYKSLLYTFFLVCQIGFSQHNELSKLYRSDLVLSDIQYKITETDTLLLDVFLPQIPSEKSKFPVLVYIHGGSWIHGNKTMVEPYYRNALKTKALENGFAVVSLNYRLLGNLDPSFPDPITDAKDAIRWIYAFADEYGFDDENIGVLGESAGSHLAMMIAYSDDNMWKDDENLKTYSSKINYIINNCGPADINKLFHTNIGKFGMFFVKLFLPKNLLDFRNDLIFKMTSESISDNRKRVRTILKEHSPVSYIEEFGIPTLSFHGTKDKVVAKKQAKILHRIFKKTEYENQVHYLKGVDHVFNNMSEDGIDDVIEKTIDFMLKHTK